MRKVLPLSKEQEKKVSSGQIPHKKDGYLAREDGFGYSHAFAS